MSSSPPSRNNAVLEEEVKALRKELEALKAAREEERNRYEHQVQEQQEHIMSLIEQLNQVETRRAAQPAVAAHKVVTHNVVTTKTVTTTRTASAAASATEQNTKVAVSSAAGGVPPKRKFVGNPSAAAPPPAQHAKGKFVKGSTAPVTALQHAWDKFCALARGEFTVKELSLVSCETLRNLMEHYNFRKPVEVAQVEAQWALLQEGQRAVPEPTLHDSAPKPHSEPYKPMISPEEFSLAGLDKRDKHFSHRPRILDEPVKRSTREPTSTSPSTQPVPWISRHSAMWKMPSTRPVTMRCLAWIVPFTRPVGAMVTSPSLWMEPSTVPSTRRLLVPPWSSPFQTVPLPSRVWIAWVASAFFLFPLDAWLNMVGTPGHLREESHSSWRRMYGFGFTGFPLIRTS